MKKNYIPLMVLSAVSSGLVGICRAAPSTAFVPASASVQLDATAGSSADDIKIMTNAPAENVTILGELKIQGDPDASFHDMIVAALDAAKQRGADFLALAGAGVQPTIWVGKMVPAGHGRSMFVAETIRGSDVNWIASIPPAASGSISLIVGKYARKPA